MSNEVYKQVFIGKKCWWKLMITANTCSMVESPSIYSDDKVNTDVFKLTILETKKQLSK